MIGEHLEDLVKDLVGWWWIKDDAIVSTLKFVEILLKENIHVTEEVKVVESRREITDLLLYYLKMITMTLGVRLRWISCSSWVWNSFCQHYAIA